MISKKIFCWSSAAAVIFIALTAIALGGDTRVGHYDTIEFSDGSNTTSVQAGSLSGDTSFTFPVNNGTSNYVLRSNGSGVASWVDTLTTFSPADTSTDGYLLATDWNIFNDKLSSDSPVVTTAVTFSNQAEARFREATVSGGTFYVGLRAPADLSADQIWDLPTADGTVGQTLGTNGSGVLDWYSSLVNPMTTAGDIIYSADGSGTPAALGIGSATTVLHGGASAPSYSAVSLTADVSGVLPIANGGSAKALTLAAGGLVYADADSFEMGAAGTASDWALSGGTGAPTFASTTTTAKTVDGSADAVQLTVQGNATQTSDIFVVEKSDGTDLLEVTNTGGTLIKGDTVGTAPASGFVGRLETGSASYAAHTSGQYKDGGSITLPAGVWDVSGCCSIAPNTGTSITRYDCGIGTNTGNNGAGLVALENYVQQFMQATVPNDEWAKCTPVWRTVTTGSTPYYLKVYAAFTISTLQSKGFIRATRIK